MRHPATLGRLVLAAVTVAASGVLASCGDEQSAAGPPSQGSTSPPSAPPSSSTPRPDPVVTPAPLPDGVIDPVALPQGPPPEIDFVAGGTIGFDGRTLETDLPEGAEVMIMGTVDGRIVVSGGLPDEVGHRFWAVDETGHADPLGDGAYESYTYPVVLVEATGHLWVTYSDRGGSGSWTWQIDVRTGEELLELRSDQDPPPGLAPADQAVVDAYRGKGAGFPQDPVTATSPDGSLVTRTLEPGYDDVARYTVVVRRTDGEVVLRLPFANGPEVSDLDARLGTCRAPERRCEVFVGVGRASFEDDEHLLVSVGLTTDDRRQLEAPVDESAIVRCDLEGRCERATDLVASTSLGVDPS